MSLSDTEDKLKGRSSSEEQDKTRLKAAHKRNIQQPQLNKPLSSDALSHAAEADAFASSPTSPHASSDATVLLRRPSASTAMPQHQHQPQRSQNDATRMQPTAANTSAASTTPLKVSVPPSIINQRFVLDKPLGAGGMGTVYKAKDLRKVEAKDRNPWVAVKLLNNAFKDHPDAFISLQREARKTQGLAHPNIVRVYDFDRDGDTVYMTMELLEGQALDAVIKQHPYGMGKAAALQLVREVGGALVEAHNLNIVHSDFKPGNIFYTRQNKAKVFDFGIARAVSNIDSDDHEDDTVTGDAREHTVFDAASLGALTPTYASYEMLTGEVPSPSDDLYALGCVAYQALTGKHPYNRMPADKALQKNLKPAAVEGLSRREGKALRKALAFKQQDRYATVDEFLHDFLPEHHTFTRKIKLALAGSLVVLAAGGYQYVEALMEEQQRSEALKIEQAKAAEKAEAFKKLQALHASQETLREQLAAAFKVEQMKAGDIQQELDQQVYLSAFASSYEWQLQTTKKLDELDKFYRNDAWLQPFYQSHSGADFSDILDSAQNIRQQAVARTSAWIGFFRKKVSNVYIDQADDFIAAVKLDKAQEMYALAKQYDAEGESVQQLRLRLDQAQLAQRQLRYSNVMAALRVSYAEANETLEKNVASCAANLAGNGRANAFSYDMRGLAKQLQQLNTRYPALKNEITANNQQHMAALANCIKLYGLSDPKGAKHQLEVAAQTFPAFAANFQQVSIRPFNTCKASFAEKGKRYTCQDRFIDNLLVKAPKLVVVPASKALPMFAISKFEVSEAEFNHFCASTEQCKPRSKKVDDLPVTDRSIEQMQGYAQWLTEQTGFVYKIPTQQQWLYAASARASKLDKNRNCSLSARGVNKGLRLVPANNGDSNRWGLVNHVGNVQELVQHDGDFKMLGGARLTAMEDCTLQQQQNVQPKDADINGLRIVRLIE